MPSESSSYPTSPSYLGVAGTSKPVSRKWTYGPLFSRYSLAESEPCQKSPGPQPLLLASYSTLSSFASSRATYLAVASSAAAFCLSAIRCPFSFCAAKNFAAFSYLFYTHLFSLCAALLSGFFPWGLPFLITYPSWRSLRCFRSFLWVPASCHGSHCLQTNFLSSVIC